MAIKMEGKAPDQSGDDSGLSLGGVQHSLQRHWPATGYPSLGAQQGEGLPYGTGHSGHQGDSYLHLNANYATSHGSSLSTNSKRKQKFSA